MQIPGFSTLALAASFIFASGFVAIEKAYAAEKQTTATTFAMDNNDDKGRHHKKHYKKPRHDRHHGHGPSKHYKKHSKKHHSKCNGHCRKHHHCGPSMSYRYGLLERYLCSHATISPRHYARLTGLSLRMAEAELYAFSRDRARRVCHRGAGNSLVFMLNIGR